MKFTDEQLTEIYKAANNELGKARPLTTQSIFTAMRAMSHLVEQATLDKAAKFEQDDHREGCLDIVEAVTKAILFEDCGNTEGWEDNTNLGLAAVRAMYDHREGYLGCESSILLLKTPNV